MCEPIFYASNTACTLLSNKIGAGAFSLSNSLKIDFESLIFPGMKKKSFLTYLYRLLKICLDYQTVNTRSCSICHSLVNCRVRSLGTL